jgi:hypothetical protein
MYSLPTRNAINATAQCTMMIHLAITHQRTNDRHHPKRSKDMLLSCLNSVTSQTLVRPALDPKVTLSEATML